MSIAIDFSDWTLQTKENEEASKVIFEDTFLSPEIKAIHDVRTGIDQDLFIQLIGNFGLLGKIDPGNCGSNTETGVIPTSEKKWEPKLISFRLPLCASSIPEDMKYWKQKMVANDLWDLVGSEIVAFITDKVTLAMQENVIRLAEFGNTNASPVGDGTGDETLTSGIAKGYFNVLNGMWAQIFADQAGAKKSYRYTISENAEATKTAQLQLDPARALEMLRAMYNNISPIAFKAGKLEFGLTRSLLNNWQDYLEDKSLGYMLNRAEDGATKWSYRGIPIVERKDWDEIISSYYDNGTTLYLPHRAILVDKMNVPIGTSDEESMKSLKVFYDAKDKMVYVDGAYRLDCKVLQEKLVASAY